MGIKEELKKLLNDRFLLSEEELIPYEKDASYFQEVKPLGVAIPDNEKEVSEILKICNYHRVSVVVRSGGSSLTGSSLPLKDSIVISMLRMNKIIELSLPDSYVIVQPGLRLNELNQYLKKYGFFYPPDPASSMVATVGGSISTNAGGLRAAMYGTTKEWVLGVRVVLANGKILEFGGKTLKRTKGYDLTSLLIGAEGTLGIIVSATLKILPIPEKIGRILSFYSSSDDLFNSLIEIKTAGITPYIGEFLDKRSMDAVRKNSDLIFPDKANFLLMIDIASTEESSEIKIRKIESIMKNNKCMELQRTFEPSKMEKMYEARKGLYSSALYLRKGNNDRVIIADVVVPPSKLSSIYKSMEKIISDMGINVLLFGHVADGNIHSNIIVNPDDDEELRKVDFFMNEIGRIAVQLGGSVSAEHGIGLEKKDLLKMEFELNSSSYNLEIMRNIKKIFDPNGILNGGKIFDP
ncbi:FAD-binding oxidoreductase [Caldiplasma sukawensis]